MSLIVLTPRQYEEFNNPIWDQNYTVTIDGEEITANTGDDDLHDLPEGVLIGYPGLVYNENDDLVMALISHHLLTPDHDLILLALLDDRVTQIDAIAALPREERAAARGALRSGLRTAARRDARRSFRIALRRSGRIEDRQEARRLMRVALREDFAAELEALHAQQAAAEEELVS